MWRGGIHIDIYLDQTPDMKKNLIESQIIYPTDTR